MERGEPAVSGPNLSGGIICYANQEGAQRPAKQLCQKIRGNFFWKEFEIGRHSKVPISEKAELCETSIHAFCSEASFSF